MKRKLSMFLAFVLALSMFNISFAYAASADASVMLVDSPTDSVTPISEIKINGWAFIPNSNLQSDLGKISVFVNDVEETNAVVNFIERPDVYNYLKSDGYDVKESDKFGFTVKVPNDSTLLSKGPVTVTLKGYDSAGVEKLVRPVSVNYDPSASKTVPLLIVDSPVEGAKLGDSVSVNGWALYSQDGTTNGIKEIVVTISDGTDRIYKVATPVERPDVNAGVVPGYPDYKNVGFSAVFDQDFASENIAIKVEIIDNNLKTVAYRNVNVTRQAGYYPFVGCMDFPQVDSKVSNKEALGISGWLLYAKGEEHGIDSVKVYANDKELTVLENEFMPRADLVALSSDHPMLAGYPEVSYEKAGYVLLVDKEEISEVNGAVALKVEFYDKDNKPVGEFVNNVDFVSESIARDLVWHIDEPVADHAYEQNETVTVQGWALASTDAVASDISRIKIEITDGTNSLYPESTRIERADINRAILPGYGDYSTPGFIAKDIDVSSFAVGVELTAIVDVYLKSTGTTVPASRKTVDFTRTADSADIAEGGLGAVYNTDNSVDISVKFDKAPIGDVTADDFVVSMAIGEVSPVEGFEVTKVDDTNYIIKIAADTIEPLKTREEQNAVFTVSYKERTVHSASATIPATSKVVVKDIVLVSTAVDSTIFQVNFDKASTEFAVEDAGIAIAFATSPEAAEEAALKAEAGTGVKSESVEKLADNKGFRVTADEALKITNGSFVAIAVKDAAIYEDEDVASVQFYPLTTIEVVFDDDALKASVNVLGNAITINKAGNYIIKAESGVNVGKYAPKTADGKYYDTYQVIIITDEELATGNRYRTIDLDLGATYRVTKCDATEVKLDEENMSLGTAGNISITDLSGKYTIRIVDGLSADNGKYIKVDEDDAITYEADPVVLEREAVTGLINGVTYMVAKEGAAAIVGLDAFVTKAELPKEDAAVGGLLISLTPFKAETNDYTEWVEAMSEIRIADKDDNIVKSITDDLSSYFIKEKSAIYIPKDVLDYRFVSGIYTVTIVADGYGTIKKVSDAELSNVVEFESASIGSQAHVADKVLNVDKTTAVINTVFNNAVYSEFDVETNEGTELTNADFAVNNPEVIFNLITEQVVTEAQLDTITVYPDTAAAAVQINLVDAELSAGDYTLSVDLSKLYNAASYNGEDTYEISFKIKGETLPVGDFEIVNGVAGDVSDEEYTAIFSGIASLPTGNAEYINIAGTDYYALSDYDNYDFYKSLVTALKVGDKFSINPDGLLTDITRNSAANLPAIVELDASYISVALTLTGGDTAMGIGTLTIIPSEALVAANEITVNGGYVNLSDASFANAKIYVDSGANLTVADKQNVNVNTSTEEAAAYINGIAVTSTTKNLIVNANAGAFTFTEVKDTKAGAFTVVVPEEFEVKSLTVNVTEKVADIVVDGIVGNIGNTSGLNDLTVNADGHVGSIYLAAGKSDGAKTVGNIALNNETEDVTTAITVGAYNTVASVTVGVDAVVSKLTLNGNSAIGVATAEPNGLIVDGKITELVMTGKAAKIVALSGTGAGLDTDKGILALDATALTDVLATDKPVHIIAGESFPTIASIKAPVDSDKALVIDPSAATVEPIIVVTSGNVNVINKVEVNAYVYGGSKLNVGDLVLSPVGFGYAHIGVAEDEVEEESILVSVKDYFSIDSVDVDATNVNGDVQFNTDGIIDNTNSDDNYNLTYDITVDDTKTQTVSFVIDAETNTEITAEATRNVKINGGILDLSGDKIPANVEYTGTKGVTVNVAGLADEDENIVNSVINGVAVGGEGASYVIDDKGDITISGTADSTINIDTSAVAGNIEIGVAPGFTGTVRVNGNVDGALTLTGYGAAKIAVLAGNIILDESAEGATGTTAVELSLNDPENISALTLTIGEEANVSEVSAAETNNYGAGNVTMVLDHNSEAVADADAEAAVAIDFTNLALTGKLTITGKAATTDVTLGEEIKGDIAFDKDVTLAGNYTITKVLTIVSGKQLTVEGTLSGAKINVFANATKAPIVLGAIGELGVDTTKLALGITGTTGELIKFDASSKIFVNAPATVGLGESKVTGVKIDKPGQSTALTITTTGTDGTAGAAGTIRLDSNKLSVNSDAPPVEETTEYEAFGW